MRLASFLYTLCAVVLPLMGLKSQVSIIGLAVQPFNITPEALLNVNIMNAGNEAQAHIVSQLYSSNNVVLLTVRSQPFKLVRGLNSVVTGNYRIASAEFASVAQSSYLRSTHTLPSGRYRLCSTVFINDASRADEFCDDIESDMNQILYLINPFDGDTIDSKYPILSWTHNEPFTILSQGELFRLVVAEIRDGQTAEAAVTANNPVVVKYPLEEHQIQYPYDAPDLKVGKQYGWQVQKISAGVVVAKSEAWKFIIRPSEESLSTKYVSLKDHIDGSFYTATEGMVFFKFFEEYKGNGSMTYRLKDDKLQDVKINIEGDSGSGIEGETGSAGVLKKLGNNLFSLSLNNKSVRSGFYTLEVQNEKRETFYLKIFLP